MIGLGSSVTCELDRHLKDIQSDQGPDISSTHTITTSTLLPYTLPGFPTSPNFLLLLFTRPTPASKSTRATLQAPSSSTCIANNQLSSKLSSPSTPSAKKPSSNFQQQVVFRTHKRCGAGSAAALLGRRMLPRKPFCSYGGNSRCCPREKSICRIRWTSKIP